MKQNEILIKPILTEGEIRLMGSTTFEEFKHIERDRGLARRLQKVVVEEASVDETVEILRGIKSRYEEHHQLEIADEALHAAGLHPLRRSDRIPGPRADRLRFEIRTVLG